MAFDSNLDEKKFAETLEFEGCNIMVGVFSYNEGAAKLQITRERVNQDGSTKFAKVGRMTKEEVVKILPVMQKALEVM